MRALLITLFLGVIICSGAAFEKAVALPQLDETGTLPCCPNPRLLGPRTRDGYGKDATFDEPAAIAYDRDDDAYFIVDAASNTVRKYDKSGRVTTVAGACDRELVMATCIGREVDGIGSIVRFDRPSIIVYSPRERAFIVYDSGSSSLRLVTASGRVSTVGKVTDINGIAVDPARDRLYAARASEVVSLEIDGGYVRAFPLWHAPVEQSSVYHAPVLHVNAITVDPVSGDLFVAVHTNVVYRLHLQETWEGTFVAGNPNSSVFWAAADGIGPRATFQSLTSLVYDPALRLVYADDFRTLRSIATDGTVKSIAGGCALNDPRYRGEFACDYPPNDGVGMRAHFALPLRGLAIDKDDGIGVLDGSYLRIVDANGRVRTVAGNHRRQRHHTPQMWSGHYLDPLSGETLDVTVNGDDETEISADRFGHIFDVKRGLRSAAYSNAEFWNAPTYVRLGPLTKVRTFSRAIQSLRCGALRDYGARNPFKNDVSTRSSLFLYWYDDAPGYFGALGHPQLPNYFEGMRCALVSVKDVRGKVVYQDYESRAIRHSVPDGLIESPDERAIYNAP